MAIGYHYTSYSLWKKIKKEGLKPYLISKPELNIYFPKPVKGIWTWIKNLKGKSHIGTIIFQAGTKKETRIVKLRYEYNKKDLLYWKGCKVALFHKGDVGNWIYHEKEPSYIVRKKIKPENIELIGDYNLKKLLK